MITELQDLVLERGQVDFELGSEVEIIEIGLHIVFELLALEPSLLEDLHIVNHIGFHDSDDPKLVSIWVLLAQVLVAQGNSTWLLH